ncbi:MAG: formate dehydrogenase subunit gamma [Betaproteobacteria bacterium]|nr:formate dehydrogenase subunit gamma [Betaproteobacteria bacterium]
MHDNLALRWVMRLSIALVTVLLPQFALGTEDLAKQQAARQITQPLNNAPMWREVRKGENPYQTTQVRGVETNILIQTEGQIWREIRNGPVTIYGGWLLVLVVVALGIFYWWRGRIMLKQPPTGRLVQRFTPWERLVHWGTAISFVVLAITGLTTLFGKYVLLPVFGYTLFSWLATLSKTLHNFVGPLFAVCAIIMFFTFVRDNIWQRGDLQWILSAGGLFTGRHVPSWRFNIAEKFWFWLGVTFLGVAVSATGFILDFSNFGQGRLLMQLSNVVHAVGALLFIALAFGHIYLGTIGMEGAYESMRNGHVDEAWVKEHHEYWYNEVASQSRTAGGVPSTAPASAMKEGWKT